MGFPAESAMSIRLETPPPASRLEAPSASALEWTEPVPSRTAGPRPAWSRPGAPDGNRTPLQWSGSTGPHSTDVRPPVERTPSVSAPKRQTPEPTAQSHSDCADAGARIHWKASPIITTSPLLREPWGSAYAYTQTTLKLFSCCALLLAAGCASIISSSKQTITVASDPADAFIQIDGIQLGKTPSTFPVQRSGETKTLTVSKDGFESETVPLTASVNPVFFGNIISGGLYGSTTDLISGAAHEYRPGYFFVLLKPSDGSSPSKAGQIKMYVVQNYGNLAKELNTKSSGATSKIKTGPALEGLFSVLNTPEGERETIKNQLKIFLDESKTALEFGIKVTTLENK